VNLLFSFLYNNRAFFIFVLLELLCSWLIIKANIYQRIAFVSSANAVSGRISEGANRIIRYFSLKSVNTQIAYENALLRQQIANAEKKQIAIKQHELVRFSISTHQDSILNQTLQFKNVYDVIAAYVINNSVHRVNNYITLDKGLKDGVAPGMGIINGLGIVGKIKACSDNYSVAYSVLHPDMSISAMLKKDKTLCTAKWDGKDANYAYLHYLSRHIKVEAGDTVLTSGYNAVYPEGIMVGIVDEVVKETAEVFLIVRVKLSTDFHSLNYVYIVKHFDRNEIDSLENANFK